MSSSLSNIVIDLIENKKHRNIDDIVSYLKSLPQFSRLKSDALRANVKQILKKYKEDNPKQQQSPSPQRQPPSQPQPLLNNKRQRNTNSNFNMPSPINVEQFLYKPKVTLSSVGGMDEIVDKIKKIISLPLENYNAFKEMMVEPVKGILICGPPGCGKTTLAYAIGGEYQIPFYKITGPDIISSLSGESEQTIRNLFNAVISKAPSILFIDEIETILGRRETASKEMEKRIVAQIMACIDEIGNIQLTELTAPVFIIGATSKPEFIDQSMRRSGRFDREIHIGFPNQEKRKQMLMTIGHDKKFSKDLNYDAIAQGTPGYLAADLQALVRTAGHHAIERYINNNLILDTMCLEQEDFDYAITVTQPTSKREGFTTIPNVTWDDIGGLKDLREQLLFSVVLPCVKPKAYNYVQLDKAIGVLLYGPPGCGKTLLAKAVANEAKANFISIKGPELLNKYVGESEKAVRALFTRARNSSPCVIFFDELDALVPKRSQDNNNAGERVVNQLLTEMDGMEDRKGIFIIGATNRPDIIDPAMLRPGRLEKMMYVPLPSSEDTLAIMKTITRKLPLDSDVNLEEINKQIDGFSGADVAALVREAQLNSLKRLYKVSFKDYKNIVNDCPNKNEEEEKFKIINEDFVLALKTTYRSVSKEDRIKYEHIRMKIQQSRDK